jgi:hypothetical protein
MHVRDRLLRLLQQGEDLLQAWAALAARYTD